nr:SPARC-like protein 1 isoform X2 [Dasypus novemcinctus]
MKTVLFFLHILGAAAAIPTSVKFLPDHSKPTAESWSAVQQTETSTIPDNTAIPIFGVKDTEKEKETALPTEDHSNLKDENSSILTPKEENQEQSADQYQSYSQELGLKDQEDSDGDFSVNLEYTPTEGILELKENMSQPQKRKLSENTDILAPNISSTMDSNQQESITKREKNQEPPINESHHQLNWSREHNQDLSEQGNQEKDSDIPNGEEDMKEKSGEVGTHNDNQEREKELPKDHSDSKEEEDGTQPDDIQEDSNQPTQGSKMQQEEFEQGNEEEEEDNSKAEIEEENTSKINKHIQDTEWQSQEGKPGLEDISNNKEMDKKTDSESLLVEPTDDDNSMPRNRAEDLTRHRSNDDHFVPSQDFPQSERAQSNYYHIKYEEERERAREKESVDTSAPGENQGAKKAESSPNEDESLRRGNRRVKVIDSCMSFQCKRGHVCEADQKGKPHCVCQDPVTCPPTKLLDQVCGTDNQTYASSCHLFATKCRLEGTKKGHQLQLDYFGACKSIPACTDFEVNQFPLRMRDWLKNILMQLYEHNPEHTGYLNEKQRNKVKKIYLDEKRLLAGDHPIELLLRDFKKNYHMYVYPVHWQFSELDQHPLDRVLTHSELAPLRASLVPMEHCITRFFEECDPNKDKHITLKEWGHCFGIKEGKFIHSQGRWVSSSADQF